MPAIPGFLRCSTSAWCRKTSGNPDAPGNRMYGEAMRWLDGERMLFGTAYPCYNLRQAVQDIDRFGFTEEHKEKFFHHNAEKLLGITLA